jgi:hypothetical protein
MAGPVAPPNAFIGRPGPPTDEELSEELGTVKALWDQLLADLAAEYNITIREWNSYSRKAGWSLRLKREKRAILYLSPCRSCFRASFALSDKAVAAARVSSLPQRVIQMIHQSRRYAEGTAVRVDVKGVKDTAVVKKLAVIKLEN